jgi:hypothetical protein
MREERAMKRLWIVLGALAVTLAALSLAMLTGSLAFHYHRNMEHEVLLKAVLARNPSAEALTLWLQKVKAAPLVASPQTREETARVVAEHAGSKAPEVRAKATRYPQMRVYQAADMLYFIYFDENGVMRDFTCVSR